MTCPYTTSASYPHHWGCIYTDGHIKTNCIDNCQGHCNSYECFLADGSRRCPDGSIGAKSHLQANGMAIGIRNLNDNSIEIVKIPSSRPQDQVDNNNSG